MCGLIGEINFSNKDLDIYDFKNLDALGIEVLIAKVIIFMKIFFK